MPRPRTILCIDDNALLLHALRDLLENSRYHVLTATNAHEGLRLLAANSVDAAVVDYEMPGMSGGDFVLAARAQVPGLRIILFTGAPISLIASAHALVDRVLAKGTLPNLLEHIKGPTRRAARRIRIEPSPGAPPLRDVPYIFR